MRPHTQQSQHLIFTLSQLTWTAYSTSKHVNLTAASQAQEVVVSYLPLSHIAAQMVDIWITMKIGGVTYFAQPDALKVRRTPNRQHKHASARNKHSSACLIGWPAQYGQYNRPAVRSWFFVAAIEQEQSIYPNIWLQMPTSNLNDVKLSKKDGELQIKSPPPPLLITLTFALEQF